jgi:hypothetical protein
MPEVRNVGEVVKYVEASVAILLFLVLLAALSTLVPLFSAELLKVLP